MANCPVFRWQLNTKQIINQMVLLYEYWTNLVFRSPLWRKLVLPPAALIVAPQPPAPLLAACFWGWGLWWKSIQNFLLRYFQTIWADIFITHFILSNSLLFVELLLTQVLSYFHLWVDALWITLDHSDTMTNHNLQTFFTFNPEIQKR